MVGFQLPNTVIVRPVQAGVSLSAWSFTRGRDARSALHTFECSGKKANFVIAALLFSHVSHLMQLCVSLHITTFRKDFYDAT